MALTYLLEKRRSEQNPTWNGHNAQTEILRSHFTPCLAGTSSSAVAKRPRDASYLSVVSFNSTIPRAQFFFISYFGFGFTSTYNLILFCCLRRSSLALIHTIHGRTWLCIARETALGRRIVVMQGEISYTIEIERKFSTGGYVRGYNQRGNVRIPCPVACSVAVYLSARSDLLVLRTNRQHGNRTFSLANPTECSRMPLTFGQSPCRPTAKRTVTTDSRT